MRKLPDDIGSLTKLQLLNLSACRLNGLPPSFANLSGLRQIAVESCPRSLIESIPAALTQGGKCTAVGSAGDSHIMHKLRFLVDLEYYAEMVSVSDKPFGILSVFIPTTVKLIHHHITASVLKVVPSR